MAAMAATIEQLGLWLWALLFRVPVSVVVLVWVLAVRLGWGRVRLDARGGEEGERTSRDTAPGEGQVPAGVSWQLF